MKRSRFALLAAILLLPLAAALSRPVKMWSVDELAARSAVIVNGLVLDITSPGEAPPRTLLSNKPVPERAYRAQVQVLAALQGMPPATLTVRYSSVDAAKTNGIVNNGPIEIYLEKGRRYRFYLNPAPDGDGYVGALAGEFDDGDAVQPLAPGDPDNAKPFSQKQALDTAEAYVRAHWPADRPFPEHSVINVGPTHGWSVEFFSREPYTYPPFTSDALIQIMMSGEIASSSWVTLAFVPPASADATLVGKRVRIMTNAGLSGGALWEVRGIVRGVDGETIGVDGPAPNRSVDPSRLRRADISSLQILAP